MNQFGQVQNGFAAGAVGASGRSNYNNLNNQMRFNGRSQGNGAFGQGSNGWSSLLSILKLIEQISVALALILRLAARGSMTSVSLVSCFCVEQLGALEKVSDTGDLFNTLPVPAALQLGHTSQVT